MYWGARLELIVTIVRNRWFISPIFMGTFLQPTDIYLAILRVPWPFWDGEFTWPCKRQGIERANYQQDIPVAGSEGIGHHRPLQRLVVARMTCDKNGPWLYRGWNTTQLYGDYNKPLWGSLLNNRLTWNILEITRRFSKFMRISDNWWLINPEEGLIVPGGLAFGGVALWFPLYIIFHFSQSGPLVVINGVVGPLWPKINRCLSPFF